MRTGNATNRAKIQHLHRKRQPSAVFLVCLHEKPWNDISRAETVRLIVSLFAQLVSSASRQRTADKVIIPQIAENCKPALSEKGKMWTRDNISFLKRSKKCVFVDDRACFVLTFIFNIKN